jgi:hypothetical protein
MNASRCFGSRFVLLWLDDLCVVEWEVLVWLPDDLWEPLEALWLDECVPVEWLLPFEPPRARTGTRTSRRGSRRTPGAYGRGRT